MAAALRHAARRIGTQAAETAASQRLHAGELPADAKKKAAAILLLRIQQKKEELYNLIDAWKLSEYVVKGSLDMENSRLLYQLSVQVKPRQDDPRWRSFRRWAIAGECCKYVGGVCIGKMAGDALVHVYQGVQNPSGK